MVWELLPVPFSGFRNQHGVGAAACALFRDRFQYGVGAVACALFRGGLVAGQEGLIQLCTRTGNSGA